MSLGQHLLIQKYGKYERFFSWLRFFYPKAKGISYLFLLYYFLPQKIFRINGRVPWPVHYTSRIFYPSKIDVGNRSAPGINAHCYVQGRCGISIGHNFRMGPGAALISANHSLHDYDTWREADPIVIGDNVWIGTNSVVLPGIEIGSNVVVGANSVVDKVIQPNSIVTGNPCRVIKDKPPYTGFDYSRL